MPINELVLPSNFVCRVSKGFIDEMAPLCDDNANVPRRLRKLDEAYGRNELQKMRCNDFWVDVNTFNVNAQK